MAIAAGIFDKLHTTIVVIVLVGGLSTALFIAYDTLDYQPVVAVVNPEGHEVMFPPQEAEGAYKVGYSRVGFERQVELQRLFLSSKRVEAAKIFLVQSAAICGVALLLFVIRRWLRWLVS